MIHWHIGVHTKCNVSSNCLRTPNRGTSFIIHINVIVRLDANYIEFTTLLFIIN